MLNSIQNSTSSAYASIKANPYKTAAVVTTLVSAVALIYFRESIAESLIPAFPSRPNFFFEKDGQCFPVKYGPRNFLANFDQESGRTFASSKEHGDWYQLNFGTCPAPVETAKGPTLFEGFKNFWGNLKENIYKSIEQEKPALPKPRKISTYEKLYGKAPAFSPSGSIYKRLYPEKLEMRFSPDRYTDCTISDYVNTEQTQRMKLICEHFKSNVPALPHPSWITQ